MTELTKVLQVLSLILMALTTLCYCYQFFYLFIPLFRKKPAAESEKTRRYAVLIAARNEEAVLPHLLDSIRMQDYPSELVTVFVVADNCTDRTAEVARARGAVVYERFNDTQIGKGYAMNYLLEQIRENGGLDRFDVFLVFDADNLLTADYISNINVMPSMGYNVFCGYRNTKNFGTNWLTSGYGLWYLHESCHMNASRQITRGCCAVNGTGFGFTRQILERLGGWKFFTLTEDIEFTNWCATNGVKIGYCHEAIVYDEQPVSFRQSWRQRTRWVQGGLQVSFRYAVALLKGIFRGGRMGLSCLEFMTLTLWGYGLSILAGICSIVLALLMTGLVGTLITLALAVCGAYAGMLFIGGWTMIMERKRIYATTGQKILSVITFPIFMLTFLPIAVTAIFRKFHWAPIEHTVAISTDDLCKK